jgi:DNA repair exonuclease SbcCD nuclease subunit
MYLNVKIIWDFYSWFKNCKNPNVISGHIHLNQKPQKNIYYPGSSLSVAFGESTKNIVAKLEFDTEEKDYNLEEIELELPKKKIIYINSEDADDIDIPKTEDKIKLSISGEYEEFKTFKKTKKYKELTSNGIKVVFKPKKKEIKTKK